MHASITVAATTTATVRLVSTIAAQSVVRVEAKPARMAQAHVRTMQVPVRATAVTQTVAAMAKLIVAVAHSHIVANRSVEPF